MKAYLKKIWIKAGVKGRLAIGLFLIFAGNVLARFVVDSMLAADWFMFNPAYKEQLLRDTFWAPLAVYAFFYLCGYCGCARKGMRDVSVYRVLPLLLVAAVVIELGAVFALVSWQSFWLDARYFVFASSACSGLAYAVSLFCVKPF